jgi:hypothetical protein
MLRRKIKRQYHSTLSLLLQTYKFAETTGAMMYFAVSCQARNSCYICRMDGLAEIVSILPEDFRDSHPEIDWHREDMLALVVETLSVITPKARLRPLFDICQTG